MRTAILDLGTNTFNLLIVESRPDNTAEIIMSRKEPVNLGKDGINRGNITSAAFGRGLSALEKHMNFITELDVKQVHAVATSAIRSACNGMHFLKTVHSRFNIPVRIISGDREAELVYLGVRQAVEMNGEKHLIIDIGGGSNELIIADQTRIYWERSFPIGMARLLDRFEPSDPITGEEIIRIENYISHSLEPFFKAAMLHTPHILVGSSGSFDTFRALLEASTGREGSGGLNFRFSPDEFYRLYTTLTRSTSSERLAMKGMDPIRVEMIVIAAIFVNFIVRKLDIKGLIQSAYSLKEGVVVETMNKNIIPGRKVNYPADIKSG